MSGSQRWLAPGWRDEAETWTLASLARLGIQPAGPFDEFRTRPWSSIWRLATSSGDVYFKALPPGLEHEVRLTARLASMFPDLVVPVLAADQARGWMLMPDAGVRLRDVLKLEEAEAAWTSLLTDCARMQIATIDLVPEFLALGVPDRRLALMPWQFDRVVALAGHMATLGSAGISREELARVTALRPAMLAQAEKLEAFGLPETVQHDDLHARNVLLKDGRALIFDWGDASISHPLFTLREALLSLFDEFDLTLEDEMLGRLRDAYLSCWLPFAPMAQLRQAYELSRPLSIIPRILTWDLAMSNATAAERDAGADFIVGLLRELLEMAM